MLFLLRPPQTRLPLALPRDPKAQGEWNRLTRASYDSTRRVAGAGAGAGAPDDPPDVVGKLRELAGLHSSGALTDDEFATAKAGLLGAHDRPT